MKEKKLVPILMLETAFLLYSITSVLSKLASAYDTMSIQFLLYYGLVVVILGIYALLWQQVIKHFELSVAYANKAVTLLWAIVWSVLLFHEKIRAGQVIGILIVMVGIFLLNFGGKESDAPIAAKATDSEVKKQGVETNSATGAYAGGEDAE